MGMPNAYKCEICGDKYFDTSAAIDQHYQSDHPGAPLRANAWKCRNCSSIARYFDTCEELTQHLADQH